MIYDCGEKPGQLIRVMMTAKRGESIDCTVRVIWRSIAKEGMVATMKVNTAKAPMAENKAAWNNSVRYSRLGGDVVSAFAACCAASLIFSTGFSSVSSGILLFLFQTEAYPGGFFSATGETGAGNSSDVSFTSAAGAVVSSGVITHNAPGRFLISTFPFPSITPSAITSIFG